MRPRRVAALTVATLLLGLTVFAQPAAALVPTLVHTLDVSAKVAGAAKPYTFHVLARDYGTKDIFTSLSRKSSVGKRPVQTHTWTALGEDLSCNSSLSTCNLDTGTHYGVYGRVHLAFAATGMAHTTTYCGDTGKRTTRTTRTGVLSGTISLNTHTEYFDIVRNNGHAVHTVAPLRGTAAKYAYGATCTRPVHCVGNLNTQATDGAGTSINVNRTLPHGKGSIRYFLSDTSLDPFVPISHDIVVKTTGVTNKVTSNTPLPYQTIDVNLAQAAPFLTGSFTSTSTSPLTHYTTPCRSSTRDTSFAGTWTVHLDGFDGHNFSGTGTGLAGRTKAGP